MNKKILAFILIILIVATVVSVAIYQMPSENHPPIASVSADSIYGKTPFVVSFNGSALDPDDDKVTYHWDFGDGSYSNSQNPKHTYNWRGRFVVNFTVKDEGGKIGSDTLEINVIDYRPPIALASADSTCGKAPLVVRFNGSGYDPDGYVVSYHWNFADGSISDEQNPEYKYDKIGKFIVHLTVTDNDGEIGTDILEINVIENYPPIAYASADKIEGRAPLKVQFYGKGGDSDGQELSYHWEFGSTPIGENGESKQQNPTFTYWKKGIYRAKLTVMDEDGAEDTAYIEITVKKNSFLEMISNARSFTEKSFSLLSSTFNLISRVIKVIPTVLNPTKNIIEIILCIIGYFQDQNLIAIQTASFATTSGINDETFFEGLDYIRATQ